MTQSTQPVVSLIVPVLDEARIIRALLDSLVRYDFETDNVEIIIVDGGSSDATTQIVRSFDICHLVESEPGRAIQMNVGAAKASGDILMFLHSDSTLPENFLPFITRDFWASHKVWGRFDVRLSGRHPLFTLIAVMMNIRSNMTGICTGDQGIFVRRNVFERIGGFASIPLMEDIEISRRLKKFSAPFRITQKLTTSSRRWEEVGILKTVLLMWQLRLRYFVGQPAEALADYYKTHGTEVSSGDNQA